MTQIWPVMPLVVRDFRSGLEQNFEKTAGHENNVNLSLMLIILYIFQS